MGSVYFAYTRGGQPVALKLVRREFADDPEFRHRFAREVEAARRVQGAYTAIVLDSSVDGSQPWLASAYVAGPTLAEAVREHGPLPLRTVLQLAAGVAEALKSIHAIGIIHRDLKPSNVLLAVDGPRVIDFGIARATDATAVTRPDAHIGTPAYMAPERVSGGPVGPAVDVFALGLVVFHAATGKHAFGEGSGQELLFRILGGAPDLSACPEQLRELVADCLAAAPEDRPEPDEIIEVCRRAAEAEGFQLGREDGWWLPEDLTEAATIRHAPPPPPSAGEQAAPTLTASVSTPRKRKRVVLTAAGVAVVAATTVAVMDFGGKPGGRPSGSGSASRSASGTGGATGTVSYQWTLTRQDVPVVLRAPTPTDTSPVVCDTTPATAFNAQDLSVETDVSYDLRSRSTLLYSDCTAGAAIEGYEPRNYQGIRLQDNQGVMDVIDTPNPSPAECHTAARRASLPDPIGVDALKSGTFLRKGRGLCIETPGGTLDYLLITDVRPEPDKDGLPTIVAVATQWEREGE
jgi:serine/threonine protein kinase